MFLYTTIYKHLQHNRKVYIPVGHIYVIMELRDRIIRESIDNVIEPQEGEFVDSLGKKHETAMDMMRAEVKYMIFRKY